MKTVFMNYPDNPCTINSLVVQMAKKETENKMYFEKLLSERLSLNER
jgi:hypothetical protein